MLLRKPWIGWRVKLRRLIGDGKCEIVSFRLNIVDMVQLMSLKGTSIMANAVEMRRISRGASLIGLTCHFLVSAVDDGEMRHRTMCTEVTNKSSRFEAKVLLILSLSYFTFCSNVVGARADIDICSLVFEKSQYQMSRNLCQVDQSQTMMPRDWYVAAL